MIFESLLGLTFFAMAYISLFDLYSVILSKFLKQWASMKKRRQSQPVSALDIAAYILANHTRNTPIAAWKMHILVYYCQVYQLISEGIPFFNEKIMATQKGIMIHELCALHYNQLYIGDSSKGNLNHLSLKQIDIIGEVMKKYGNKTLEELGQLIQLEAPWKKARQETTDLRVSVEIIPISILELYNQGNL
ncbi:putative uncharacterized protein [Parachlamydia acanthamoebae UV-7]|uniref:Antitoxin SocA-like Panacea domain-containing protein n=1 Tax=Parachlamydia acanthamoebae (strain UV7) TaxID=765952 RepID=F8KV10_PARAV|nr:putative uncharacterized protein [Parachlamydia acanthamoebae UV-7]